MDKFLRNILIVCILVLTCSVSYYLVIYIPYKNERELSMKESLMLQEKLEREDCKNEANERAKKLLRTKAEMYPYYKEAADKELFLKEDFDAMYENCLSTKALQK